MYGRKYIFKGGTEKHYISWKNSSKTKQITKRHFHFKNIFTESFFNASRGLNAYVLYFYVVFHCSSFITMSLYLFNQFNMYIYLD